MQKENNNARESTCLYLDRLSTREAKEAADAGKIIILPIGSVEEHGVHLPLCADSLLSEYIALEVAKRTGCLVAPLLRYGVCNTGRNFPGTISIAFDSLCRITRDILSELVRNGFNRIIILSGHAESSHMVALTLAAQEVVQQDQPASCRKTRIMVLSDFDFAFELKAKLGFSERDGHAGALETSRFIDVASDLIKGKGEAGIKRMPRFEVISDPERYFPNGVNGDPTKATKGKGKMINEYVIKQVGKLVEELKK